MVFLQYLPVFREKLSLLLLNDVSLSSFLSIGRLSLSELHCSLRSVHLEFLLPESLNLLLMLLLLHSSSLSVHLLNSVVFSKFLHHLLLELLLYSLFFKNSLSLDLLLVSLRS